MFKEKKNWLWFISFSWGNCSLCASIDLVESHVFLGWQKVNPEVESVDLHQSLQHSGAVNLTLDSLTCDSGQMWLDVTVSFSSPQPRLSSSQSKIDSGRWSLPIPSPRKIPALILKYVCVYVIWCGVALLSFVYIRMTALICQGKHTFSCKNQYLMTISMASMSCSVWTAWSCVMLVHCRTMSA